MTIVGLEACFGEFLLEENNVNINKFGDGLPFGWAGKWAIFENRTVNGSKAAGQNNALPLALPLALLRLR